MFKVLGIHEKEEWKRIIRAAHQFDFYHTYDYHKLALKSGEGTPKLFYYQLDDQFIALPLLERVLDEKNKLIDYTSVYGYAGPVYSMTRISDDLIKGFIQKIKEYMQGNNAISVFSRLHPLIKQEHILHQLGNVDLLSKTVTIELENSLDEQRRKYRKSNKSEINKLRRSVECKEAETEAEIDAYISIYLDNMKRVEAAERYFFNKDYFFDLLNAEDFKTKIILAYETGEIMGGAMFIYTDDIVQYHLAGTAEKYLSKTPMKLILDETRINSSNNNFKYFHLGGGVGSKEDSLFKFKSGFSDRYDQFKLWKYIVNPEIYNSLVDKRKEKIEDYNYFPLYRG
ncbi:MAG: GNAT family N-acetyltransferase [Bacteroidota bacterium]|nr:GNAT family N-acetyltransferase [Bacteroidota bacterium]